MSFYDLIWKILGPEIPKYPHTKFARYEELLPEGLPMGTLIIGRQGSGKTTAVSNHIVDYFLRFPDRAIIVLDNSGSNTDEILKLIAQRPDWQELSSRIVYEDLGNPEWVVPLPEFSDKYGLTFDEQAQRVAKNLDNLAPELAERAPVVAGIGLKEIAPQLFRIITAIQNDLGDTWQATEARDLLTDPKKLTAVVEKFGFRYPQAKRFFLKEFLPLSKGERELRTYALRSMLGAVESPELIAGLGYYRPGFTYGEAIQKGLMVITDGARLLNRRGAQHYLFTQRFSMLMAEINKRRPANPSDLPVSLIMDEVYSLMKIPSMAPDIAELSPKYRSRKLQLYIVLQELAQMSKELKEHIWSLGNIVSFGISNFQEAYEIAQQLFKYDPKTIKMGPRSDVGQPIVEPDRGQYLQIANDLQNLAWRECILRRYITERQKDPFVQWVRRTKEVPQNPPFIPVPDLKQLLLERHGVRVRDALEMVYKRMETKQETERRTID